MASTRDNDSFKNEIMATYPLDDAIIWIRNNMMPEDIFGPDVLEDWANERGFVRG